MYEGASVVWSRGVCRSAITWELGLDLLYMWTSRRGQDDRKALTRYDEPLKPWCRFLVLGVRVATNVHRFANHDILWKDEDIWSTLHQQMRPNWILPILRTRPHKKATSWASTVTWRPTNETVGVGRTFNTTATKDLNKAGFRCVAENAIERTASRTAVLTVYCE